MAHRRQLANAGPTNLEIIRSVGGSRTRDFMITKTF
jgi:hypothetical protein